MMMRHNKKDLKSMSQTELIELVVELQDKLKGNEKTIEYLEIVRDGLITQLRQLEEKFNEKVELPTFNLAIYNHMKHNPGKKVVESDAIRQDMLNLLVSNLGRRFNVAKMTNLLTRKYSDHSNLYRTVWTIAKDKDRMKLPGYTYHYDDDGHVHEFWLTSNKKEIGYGPHHCSSCQRLIMFKSTSINMKRAITIKGTTWRQHRIIRPFTSSNYYYVHETSDGDIISIVRIDSEIHIEPDMGDIIH